MNKARRASGANWVLAALCCCWPVGEPATGAADPETGQHCLWRVEGREATVYLLGSIHFLKKEYYPLAPPIEAAFRQAKRVVFETDFGELKSPATQAKLLEMGMCPNGKTIRDYLSKETYAALQDKLEERVGMQGAFDRMKPWLAAVSLLTMELQALGFDPEQGVDNHFYRRAQEEGKTIGAIETVDFQLKLFGELSEEDQNLLLKQTLEEIGQFKKDFGEITAAWKTGAAARLADLLLESMRDYPRVYRKLLVDRNKAWVPKLEELLAGKQPILVVVGAGHLVGKDSVVALLEKKGFKVKQL